MSHKKEKISPRIRRQRRVRKKVLGTAERPRLCVFRSLSHIYVQAIDDSVGATVACASSIEQAFPKPVKPAAPVAPVAPIEAAVPAPVEEAKPSGKKDKAAKAEKVEKVVKPAKAPVNGYKVLCSEAVGRLIAERLKAKGVVKAVFDRNGFLYHGRVKAVADAARKAGLQF